MVAYKKKVILLSNRSSHCEELMSCLASNKISCTPYMGGTKVHELKVSETKDVLLAMYVMSQEGLDIPSLDALVLATPRFDVVQACGRILHGKSKNLKFWTLLINEA